MIHTIKHCPPNPTLEYADSLEIPKGVTGIYSIGGGSTIDVGKWVADKYGLPHTAVPTTAGTGSEVTRYCVLTVDGKKKTFELKKPDSYILDPSLVTSLPELHTLSSGLDAISQALEAMWSKNSTTESYAYANSAMHILPANLLASLKDPENQLYRANMLFGANLAGRAIEITKTNVCHAISYPLTDIYDIPHGIACGLTLSFFAKCVKINIEDFLKKLPFPEYKFDKEKVAKIALKSEKLKDYPNEITLQDILSSFR